MTDLNLTPASRKLFLDLAKDAANWSGTPLFGGNVGDEIRDKGNLTDLKVKGLVTTFAERNGRGQPVLSWVEFTPAGRAFAAENGIEIE